MQFKGFLACRYSFSTQKHRKISPHDWQLRYLNSAQRGTLAKQVQALYDVCRMAGSSCRRHGACVSMLNLSGFFSSPSRDERAIQTAVAAIKNNPDFFPGEGFDLVKKAADWRGLIRWEAS